MRGEDYRPSQARRRLTSRAPPITTRMAKASGRPTLTPVLASGPPEGTLGTPDAEPGTGGSLGPTCGGWLGEDGSPGVAGSLGFGDADVLGVGSCEGDSLGSRVSLGDGDSLADGDGEADSLGDADSVGDGDSLGSGVAVSLGGGEALGVGSGDSLGVGVGEVLGVGSGV